MHLTAHSSKPTVQGNTQHQGRHEGAPSGAMKLHFADRMGMAARIALKERGYLRNEEVKAFGGRTPK